MKKLIDKASARVKLALTVLLIGGASLLASNKTFAQSAENLQPKVDEKYQPKIEWVANVSEEEKKDLEQEINLQKDWLVNYINSSKFTERLTKEQMRMEEIGVYGKSEEDYQKFLNSPAFNTFEVDQKGDTVIVLNHIAKHIEYINGQESKMTDGEFEKILEDGEFLDAFVPSPDISKASEMTKIKVNWHKNTRLERLEEGKIIILDSIPTGDGGSAVGFFDGENMNISLIKNFNHINQDETTPVHEETHKSTLMNMGLNNASFLLIINRAQGKSEYLNNPAEIVARINQLRFLLEQEDIYDTSTEDFQEDHFIKTLKNKRIMGNFAVRQLIDALKKNDLIWFMNNIADTNISSIDVAHTV